MLIFFFPNNSPTETETIKVADIALTVTDTTTFDSVDVTNTTAVQTAVIINTSTNVTGFGKTGLIAGLVKIDFFPEKASTKFKYCLRKI